MSSNSPPPPDRDVKDFEFIQLVKFRVSAPDQEIPARRGKLLACSSQYGLVIYATQQGFSVVRTADLLSIDEARGKERSKAVVQDVPVLAGVGLGCHVICMDVSSDGLFLAVAVQHQGHLAVLFYDLRSFADKGQSPAPFARSHVTSTPSAVVCDMSWNPAVPTMLVVCTSDGNVELIDVTDMPKVVAVLPAAAGATCFCWSPKGKQLLVGRKDGTLAQYDHVLAEKKVWPCPGILAGSHRVVDVVWQSTYIFLAAYLPAQAQPSDQPVVVMTMSNKENKTSHINFEDVCFGNGEDRVAQYFFHFVQKWDIILMASSNATETTIVGRNLDDKVSWEHWNLEDCSRAELPLTQQQSDSFPVGLAVDYSPHKNITINESKNLPPCPVMFLLSTDGLLICYHLSYTHRDAAAATAPPLPLTAAGARRGVPELVAALTNAPRGPVQHPGPAALPVSASQPVTAASLAPSTPPNIPPAVAAQTAKATSPTPVFAATTTFPFTKSSAVPQPTSQLPFSSFISPAPTTAASVFPFAGVGSKQGTPTSGASNQKQPSSIQTPPTSAFSQSGPSPFSFGSQSSLTSTYSFGSTLTTTSGSPNVGVPFSLPSAAQGPARPFSQTQPPGTFVAGLPTQGQSQTLGVASTASVFGQSQTSSVAARDSGNQMTSTPGIFGYSQAARDEGLKPSPSTTTPQPPGQAQPQAPPAFTSKPASLSQGQSAQTPGNGLVLTQPGRRASPAPSVQPDGTKFSETFVDSTRFIEATVDSADSTRLIEATVDSAFTHNILEEIADFERELAELRAHSRRAVKTVGTREEMQILRQDKEKMVNFAMEINKATKEQLTEVQDQKAMCFNLLAMSEECQTRHKRDLDPHYHSLLLNRVLDPASTERLRGLQQMSQAIEQNVLEVDRTLDDQWQEHLTKKKKEERFYTPAGETIYKSIRNNHIVISSQRQQLEKLEEQLKSLRLYSKLSGRLFSAVHSLNGDETSPLKVEHKPDVTLDSAVVNGMTPEKVAKLREFLSHRKVPRIKSTAPANLSMSRIVLLTPAKNSASGITPTHAELQQQTPQRPQQQRKHQLPHPVQSLANPSSFQAGPPTGQPPPGIQKQHDRQQPGSNQTKLLPGLDEAQRPSPAPFSGMTHFKQQAESVAPSRYPTGDVSSPAAKTGGVMLPAGTLTRPPLSSAASGARFGSVPSQPGHTTSPMVTAIHASAVSHPNTPHSTALLTSTATPHSSTLPPATNLHFYENITPTETEEDDDDYDEEDNGYEDEEEEEEEEEDEEETGFEGIPLGNQSLSKPNLAQMMAQQATKNLQGVPQFNAHARADGSGAPGGSVVSSSTSAGIFKLPQPSSEGNVTVFTPLKTTAQMSAVPENSKPSVVAPSTSRNLFGVTAAAGPVFGGVAVFGDKPGPRVSPNGPGSIFGSQATPSKTVGFSDLTESLASAAGKDSARQGGPISAAVPAATEVVVSQSSTSPSAASVSSAANAFSFVQASAGSSTPHGGNKPTPSSIFGGQASSTPAAAASVFGGKSPSDGSRFSFGTTSSASSGTGFVFGTSSGSPASTFPVFGTTGTSSPTAAAGATPEPSGRPEKDLGNVAESSSAVVSTTAEESWVDCLERFGCCQNTAEVQGVKTSLWGVKQEDNQDTSATSSEATTTPSVFGTTSPTPSSSLDASKPATSSFLASGTALASTSPIFGSSPAKEATPSVFGGATSSTATTPLFGTQTSTATAASPFGSSPSIFVSGAFTAPLFGSIDAATTTPSVFGSGTSTSAFGGSSAASSIFGGGTTTSASSVFGGGTTTSASSVFGGTTTSASAFSAAGTPLFGGTSTTKPSSLFSSSAGSSTPAFGGFGSGASATSPPVFGAPSTPASSGTGVFGGGNSGGLFGSSSTPAVSSASTGLFGAGSTSAFSSSATSQTGSPFGQPPASAGFGSVQPSSTGGGSSLFGQSSAFGQQPASSSSGSLFGFGGLGGKPSEEKAKLNVFGSPQVFGSTTNQNTNLFGSGGTSSFGGTEAPSYFSSTNTGRFSGEATGVSTSGFGVSSTQQASGGFGAAPAFRSAPSFGGASTFGNKVGGFGSSPSFGGSPSFAAPATFSSPGGSPSTFGSSSGGGGFSGFANTAAPTFGQLAQSSPSAGGFGAGGGFGSTAQTQPAVFGGSFGAQQSSFSGGSLFGQGSPNSGFGGAQPQGFTNNAPSFGANPAFSSYRG